MFYVHELMEYRMQQQIAHEIYRQQIIQRIPDPFPQMLPFGMPHHMMIPSPRQTLSGNVEAKLENNDLWQQFHKIGTEMIITKSGRRMFPSMRVSVKGLEDDSQYCVLLEMVPIGDCRYKFSGSQWIPAGGAEPQSPQRMFLHPDSPATGSHWQSQTVLFNKVKLTNNTMDSSGHMVLASMHKYQPRLHIIKTCDLSQLPWAPQECYIFPETEFIAVTAYQNDRITKMKIDNNPFAKGFRETGQSKCKRKMISSSSSLSPSPSSSSSYSSQHEESDDCLTKSEDDRSSVLSFDSAVHQKRARPLEISDEESCSYSVSSRYKEYLQAQHQQHLHAQYLGATSSSYYYPQQQQLASSQLMQHHLHSLMMNTLGHELEPQPLQVSSYPSPSFNDNKIVNHNTKWSLSPTPPSSPMPSSLTEPSVSLSPTAEPASQKKNNFSISAILAY